jgi:hypothetical protein
MVALIFHGNRHSISRAVSSGEQPNLLAIHSLNIARGAGKMKKIIVLLVAVGLTLTATISVPAGKGPVTPVPVPVSSATTGIWIVGGIGFGVISVMVRAGYVGNRENRELTSGEAMSAFLLPFFWTIFPGDLVGQPKHKRRDGSITASDYKHQERHLEPFYHGLIDEGSSYSGQVLVAPSSIKPPKPGAPTLGGSGGSQKN